MEMTLKVIASFGNNVLELVKENPYILMEKVDRIGFKKNDDFAFNLGIKPDDPVRLKALILHALKEVINNSGNTFVESEALYRFITTRYQIESFEFNQYLKMIDLLVRKRKSTKKEMSSLI